MNIPLFLDADLLELLAAKGYQNEPVYLHTIDGKTASNLIIPPKANQSFDAKLLECSDDLTSDVFYHYDVETIDELIDKIGLTGYPSDDPAFRYYVDDPLDLDHAKIFLVAWMDEYDEADSIWQMEDLSGTREMSWSILNGQPNQDTDIDDD